MVRTGGLKGGQVQARGVLRNGYIHEQMIHHMVIRLRIEPSHRQLLQIESISREHYSVEVMIILYKMVEFRGV